MLHSGSYWLHLLAQVINAVACVDVVVYDVLVRGSCYIKTSLQKASDKTVSGSKHICTVESGQDMKYVHDKPATWSLTTGTRTIF